jgi:hypothetical protein
MSYVKLLKVLSGEITSANVLVSPRNEEAPLVGQKKLPEIHNVSEQGKKSLSDLKIDRSSAGAVDMD